MRIGKPKKIRLSVTTRRTSMKQSAKENSQLLWQNAYRDGDMTNVIQFTGITTLNLEPDITLENTKGKLKGFVILGYNLEGEEYFASTYADGGDVLWLIERMKKKLLDIEGLYE
jgi:hypothetical protein